MYQDHMSINFSFSGLFSSVSTKYNLYIKTIIYKVLGHLGSFYLHVVLYENYLYYWLDFVFFFFSVPVRLWQF